MSWILDEKEFMTTTALAASERYRLTLMKLVETEEVWSLCDDTLWAMGQDPFGRQFLPIWPHQEFARRCRGNRWTTHEPKAIDLKAWRERWIHGIHEAHKFISVFPVPSAGAVMVSPEQMRKDLDREIEMARG